MLHRTNNSKFNIGDIIRIKSGGYGKYTYRITGIDENGIHFSNHTDPKDISTYVISHEGTKVYGDDIKIVEKAIDSAAINIVSVRLTGESLGKGEKEFVKTQNALEKAIKEFRENKSIRFENGRLTFVSRDSGEQRNITKFGCDFKTCPCQNQISYHSALYAICEQAAKVVSLPKADSVLFGVGEKVAA